MIKGPLVRTRSSQLKYLKTIKSRTSTGNCAFCNFSVGDGETKKEYTHFYVTINLFPYDQWDGHQVIEHLMIVPKRHIEGLHEYSAQEKDEYLEIVGSYEQQGYSLYSRAPTDHTKSVLHQHSHLIKLSKKQYKFVLFSSKPHITLYK